jgi:multisubunit Na+/H+ antiporter MnhC subunit
MLEIIGAIIIGLLVIAFILSLAHKPKQKQN